MIYFILMPTLHSECRQLRVIYTQCHCITNVDFHILSHNLLLLDGMVWLGPTENYCRKHRNLCTIANKQFTNTKGDRLESFYLLSRDFICALRFVVRFGDFISHFQFHLDVYKNIASTGQVFFCNLITL